MDATGAVSGLSCPACGQTTPSDRLGRCPACDGPLVYDIAPDGIDRSALDARAAAGLGGFESVLPLEVDHHRSLGAGMTPLLDLPSLAAGCEIGALGLKVEGRNPTGSLADRGAALVAAAALDREGPAVALPSAGNSAQAVAAVAARAGLDCHAFVPSRAPFHSKAMINVHGADMTVVPGGYAAAADAYDAAAAEADWFPAGPFATPLPLEGAKTVAYEVARQGGWSSPDAVVAPIGHGLTLAGLWKGFDELRRFGLLAEEPRLIGVQPAGCAPVADAWDGGAEAATPVEHPDTVCGDLEIPAPTGAALVRHALERTGGEAVAVADDASLEAAVSLARAGPAASLAGGVAMAGLRTLAEAGVLGPNHDVVVVDPLAGPKDADVLRSHLMRTGD